MNEDWRALGDWFRTPHGRYLLAWEQHRFDDVVADLFGYHALQLGLPELDALQASRMPHRWLASSEWHSDWLSHEAGQVRTGSVTAACRPVAVHTDFAALPFDAGSLDLVLLPHALELHSDPHSTLSEVARVLMPEGRVVISGLNPASLWAFRQQRAHLCRRLGFGNLYLPQVGEFIGYRRLRDWLRLLSFEVETVRFGCYLPAVESERWIQRLSWVDPIGARWWSHFGAVYFLVAVKRVRGMRLLPPAWKVSRVVANAPVSVARRTDETLPFEPVNWGVE